MKNRSPENFLRDIIQSIELIEKYTQGLSKKTLFEDRKNQDAILRNFEIIGEAVKNLPEEMKRGLPHVPWREIAGMRDIVIHEYFDLNEEDVWDTIQNDLPPFKKEIKKLLT
jgi:uncharacterized protein with HEPN domain